LRVLLSKEGINEIVLSRELERDRSETIVSPVLDWMSKIPCLILLIIVVGSLSTSLILGLNRVMAAKTGMPSISS
jgi:hypothetical protein